MSRCPRWVIPGDLALLVPAIADCRPATLILDVEPLVAPWDSDISTFVQKASGLCRVIAAQVPSMNVLVFATNSRRPRPGPPADGTLRTLLVTGAAKPWRTSYLRDLPRPIVVAGDQVLTDGLLAWRLDATFLHYAAGQPVPWWPRIQGMAGRLAVSAFFTDRPMEAVSHDRW